MVFTCSPGGIFTFVSRAFFCVAAEITEMVCPSAVLLDNRQLSHIGHTLSMELNGNSTPAYRQCVLILKAIRIWNIR